jgi:hypothetical protein
MFLTPTLLCIVQPGVNVPLFQGELTMQFKRSSRLHTLTPTPCPEILIAMNASFFFLILSLLFLGYMTDWNKHVLFLMLVSTGLWMTMIWCVCWSRNPSERSADGFRVYWQVCTRDH